MFSGPDRHLDAVQAELEQAVVDDQRDRGRDDVLPGVAPVDPVADLRPPRRAADDVGDRQLPGEHVVDGDRERQRPALAGLPAQVADQRPEGARRGRCRPAARWPPTGAASRRCGGAPRSRRARRSPPAAGARPGPARSSTRHGAPRVTGSVVAPDDLLDRVHAAAGTTTASPSLTPPREPGRFTTSACPHDAGQPARQRRGGDALADAVRPDRLGDARHLAVEQRPGDLGGQVGRGEAGAARW